MSTRYLGFFAENTGFGRAARAHARSLAHSGYEFSVRSVLLGPSGVVDVAPRGPDTAFLRRRSQRAARFATQLVHTPPPRFALFREPGVRNIGITAWETLEPPQSWRQELDAMDALWVPSSFSKCALSRLTKTPIEVVPHPVPLAALDGPRRVAGVPDDCFVFLAVLEWAERKNPSGLVQSFVKAFSGRRDVVLLMKLSFRYGLSPERVLSRLRRLRGTTPAHPRVLVCAEELSDAAMARLYRRADAYVSLHRAEGFGLCLAEAMAAERPVVATAYSGNMDFMDESTAFTVEFRSVPADDRLTPLRFFDRSMTWAEPLEESAIEALRSCEAQPARREKLARAGRERVSQLLDPARIGEQMRALLS